MEAIYKFHFDCGRMGDLYGVFVEEKEKVDALIESEEEIYFGEVLGKHSEIMGPIEEGADITLVSTEKGDVETFKRLKLANGFNPFNYKE